MPGPAISRTPSSNLIRWSRHTRCTVDLRATQSAAPRATAQWSLMENLTRILTRNFARPQRAGAFLDLQRSDVEWSMTSGSRRNRSAMAEGADDRRTIFQQLRPQLRDDNELRNRSQPPERITRREEIPVERDRLTIRRNRRIALTSSLQRF